MEERWVLKPARVAEICRLVFNVASISQNPLFPKKFGPATYFREHAWWCKATGVLFCLSNLCECSSCGSDSVQLFFHVSFEKFLNGLSRASMTMSLSAAKLCPAITQLYYVWLVGPVLTRSLLAQKVTCIFWYLGLYPMTWRISMRTFLYY